MSRLSIAVVSLAALACGGPGNVKGSVQGHSLDVLEAAFTGTGQVVISDKADLCSRLKSRTSKPGETSLALSLTRFVAMQRSELDVGDYDVVRSVTVAMGDGRFGTATFVKLDETCGNTIDFTHGSGLGSIGLISVTGAKHASGTFDISFGDPATAERITGSFDAPFCELPSPLPDAACK